VVGADFSWLKTREGTASTVSHDDVIHRFRLALFARAAEVGVSEACRQFGLHRSTYYRWHQKVQQWGLDALHPRERRKPRMPNQTPPWIEQRVVAFALGYPGFGPRRIAAELARPQWGGVVLSANGVWLILRRHGLSRRERRLALVAGAAAPPGPERPEPQPERHLDASKPGDLVQLDCFTVGRLSGTKGRVWQYTAIDVASGFTWADLHATPHNPDARFTSALLGRVQADLKQAGWRLQRISTDNGSEFRSQVFRQAAADLGVAHRFIHAGRPQSNGAVERVQRTILEECWRRSFARSLVPRLTALQRDLESYLRYYNYDRVHLGRLTNGRIPADIVFGANKMRPRT
jgi:transposase InsO family protein